MLQRLDDREIGVGESGVLADHGNVHLALQRVDAGGHLSPLFDEWSLLAHIEAELLAQQSCRSLGLEHQRNVVDVRHIVCAEHVVFGNVAEQGEFLLGIILQRFFRAADEEIGGDSGAAEFLHRVLSRFGLLLTHHPQHRDQADMHEADVLPADSELELAQSFDERCALDVAHRSA